MNTISRKNKSVIVIGGGVNGLCVAYYLRKNGFEITLIDRGDITNNCSFGNMGFLSPSHFTPLASPGVISEGLKHLLSKTSPFYIKPRLNYSFMRWMLKFYKNSSYKVVDRNAPALSELLLLSRRLMNEIAEDIGDSFMMEEIGCMMMCHSKKTFDGEARVAEASKKFNLNVEILERDELQAHEPNVELDIHGAILFKDDAHIHPGKFMLAMKNYLINAGVNYQLNTTVKDFEKSVDKVTQVITDQGTFSADEIVITPGSWMPELAKKLKTKILMEGGKGYSYTYDDVKNNIKYPAILVDDRCAITPWKQSLRIGGTMEFSGLNEKVSANRMKGIYHSIKKYYPGLDIDLPPADQIWVGLRPVTPDGLPYIGRPQKWENVAFGGGHAMLGMSAGAATGLILSNIVSEQKLPMNIDHFSINRFAKTTI
ncbi:FAD-dependent oxidoreductase [Membranicola marinus]|uniref:FAD-dependent oxidoreductase n=1 Tax=Membranihabitans marinus TaxID=1227546 RepID=A0A953L859_9BACT|nr:FAD-dependent oxidoreductase [Membranihabitans marinus]MBY5957345.1 FAD-dependent oxidoreductase [Membranihabitans marinus]